MENFERKFNNPQNQEPKKIEKKRFIENISPEDKKKLEEMGVSIPVFTLLKGTGMVKDLDELERLMKDSEFREVVDGLEDKTLGEFLEFAEEFKKRKQEEENKTPEEEKENKKEIEE